jgi:CubicO group peptidase (beta-lactamase class C family)
MNGSSWLRFTWRSGCGSFWLLTLATAASADAEIRATDCARAAKYSESKRGVSMLVLQNGQTIFEHYANGGSPRGRWPIFSGTKSFWGIVALAAMRDGLFKLDDPVSDTITEWKSDSRKSRITIRELLTQTDGIEGASRLQRASVRDRNAIAIQLPVVAEPGSAFIYGPSHLQIFSELLRRKLRGRSTIGYFEGRVSNRLGLGRLNYKKDARGNPLPATGFELTAREWACLGELVLGQGTYHGRQIVPAAFLREAFAGSAANPSYGLTFWLNRQAPDGREADLERMLDLPWQSAEWIGVCICKDAPADMIVALGSH